MKHMDDLFYRKKKRRLTPVSLLRKAARSKRAMIGLLVGVPLAAFLLFGNRGIIVRVRLMQQKAELEARIRDAEAETKRLQAESKALDGDKKAIEKVAREKYGMVRDGETVYKVSKKP